jgi:hypothetical protein
MTKVYIEASQSCIFLISFQFLIKIQALVSRRQVHQQALLKLRHRPRALQEKVAQSRKVLALLSHHSKAPVKISLAF